MASCLGEFSFPFQGWSLALGFQRGKLRQAVAVQLSLPGVVDKLGFIKWGDVEAR